MNVRERYRSGRFLDAHSTRRPGSEATPSVGAISTSPCFWAERPHGVIMHWVAVQIRVTHRPGVPTQLPLRVKAFAVLQSRLGPAPSTWLPLSASPDVPPHPRSSSQHTQQSAARRGDVAATVALAGTSAVSHRFSSYPPVRCG